ncbi:MAG: Holliday junction resolvase YqgF [Acidobacteria bacterium]|nr:Holliday junction resolvase YqgF [Acidobacteriota bacterium]
MRALGVDFGERRIGLALSDGEGRMALPFRVVERSSDAAAIAAIAALAREHEVGRLVVGLPHRSGEGPPSETLERARSFGEKLAAATGLEVEWVDEAYTSAAAAERLREAGLDARRARPRLDAVAAQILLQEALDRRRSGEERK